jgi:hypothetical protein
VAASTGVSNALLFAAVAEERDGIDEALGLLESIAMRAVRVLERIASEHWNPSGRDHAAAILEGHNQAT